MNYISKKYLRLSGLLALFMLIYLISIAIYFITKISATYIIFGVSFYFIFRAYLKDTIGSMKELFIFCLFGAMIFIGMWGLLLYVIDSTALRKILDDYFIYSLGVEDVAVYTVWLEGIIGQFILFVYYLTAFFIEKLTLAGISYIKNRMHSGN